MKKLFASFLLISSTLASAQELHTFSNGEVADAEKINENFEALKSEISGSGGCSAEQDGSSVVITCADGTSGVLAGAGTVVLIPEGEVGETPDYSAINVGDFYWVDGNGVLLGERANGSSSTYTQGVFSDYCPRDACNKSDYFRIDLVMDHEAEVVFIDPYNFQVYYTELGCEGPALTQDSARNVFMLGGNYVVWSEDTLPSDTLVYSSKTTRYFRNQSSEWIEESDCLNIESGSVFNGKFVIPYTPASEILNATYPLRLEQRP